MRKTNREYVLLALDDLGVFQRPHVYRNHIKEKYGIIVNPSDVTKYAGSLVHRLQGIPRVLEREAIRFLDIADNNKTLAIEAIKRCCND